MGKNVKDSKKFKNQKLIWQKKKKKIRYWAEGLNCRLGMLPAAILGNLNPKWTRRKEGLDLPGTISKSPDIGGSLDSNPEKCR